MSLSRYDPPWCDRSQLYREFADTASMFFLMLIAALALRGLWSLWP